MPRLTELLDCQAEARQWHNKAQAALAKCQKQVARIAALEAMLKRLEWTEYNGRSSHCPVCYGIKHGPGCELAKLLGGEG